MPAQLKTAGQRHRDAVARISRDNTRSVQEIAPLPAMKDPKRRMACRKDLKTFCLEYFPKIFELPFSSYHLQVIKRLEDMMMQGGGKLALAMPRGSGKTTLATTAVIWALLYGHCRYIVIIGANKDAANKLITNIKKALTENRTLRDDFPESIYPFFRLGGSGGQARGQRYLGELTGIEWKPASVVFAKIPGSPASGAMLYSVGIKGAIRGANRIMPDGSMARPDMVVLDDPQTDAAAKSKTQIEGLSEIIDKSVEGLVGPGQELAMVMTCTVIQEGDLASLYLKDKKQWRGLRFKMVEKMPDRMNLWEQYRSLRYEDPVKATIFYKQNRSAMQEGAIVAWKENYPPKTDESSALDALQHAMNKWADNEASFMSECQNEPMRPDQGAMVVPARVIRTRLNGLDYQTLPMDAQTLTGFIDVHDDLLYYAVAAWSDDFTGYIVDYGTYPKQVRREFSKGDTRLITMSRPDQRSDGVVYMGLISLIKELMTTHWYLETADDRRQTAAEDITFSKLLIDTGYKPQVVENAIRRAVGPSRIVMPARGKSIKAVNLPMKEWKQKAGERQGHHWLETTPTGRARSITVDTNFWKCQVHDAFRLLPGNRGSLTLWGRDAETHKMFSEHMNGEVAKLVESGGNTIYEWQDTPNDNHFFDCIVGCMVAASHTGIQSAEEKTIKVKTRSSVIRKT